MGTNDERQRAHAVVFDEAGPAVHAAKTLRADGYEVVEAYTPFAVHGMDEALGMKETGLPWATFAAGTVGLILGLGFPIWTHAVDWPLNIGGKSFVAWEAIVPVAFEVTVLLSAFGTLGALFYRSKLKPPRKPVTPSGQPMAAVTDNRFVLVVAETDGSFVWSDFSRRCQELGAMNVEEGWRIT